MDKRSWPWRKKSLEKITASIDSAESSPAHSSRHPDDQDVSRILLDHVRVSDDATVHWHQSEEKLKHLNERLSVALLDISAKDDLVKQHAKVAEEAVSGWEKAEAEAATIRQQLDAAIQQKLATEDRVLHLDGALKECMRQLRHVREEQEQKIHDAIIKKTRDWDQVRIDLEEKLADVGRQLLEAGAENKAMSKSLQERARTISELSEAQSRAEAEVKVLQIQLDTLEKENASFKYEIHVLKKELEIRNEEKDISKKSADIASKQHLEDVKKIGKLEAECQRLRILVRKKLPGPAALTQMRLEVEALEKDKSESNRRRSSGKGAGSPKTANVESMQECGQESGVNEAELLSERLLALEEETKMLKEALAKRNTELQDARLMCARTASKLSSVEEQFDALSRSQGLSKIPGQTGLDMLIEASRSLNVSKEPSLASVSEDGNDGELSCAESWASALIAELAQFKKVTAVQNPDKAIDASNLDLMDDFIEMERLASMSASKISSGLPVNKPGENVEETAKKDTGNVVGVPIGKDKIALEQILAKREAELQATNQLCKEVSNKLALAEEQLKSLQSKNAANEATLVSLQEKLDLIFEAHEEGANVEKVLEEVKSTKGASHNSVARLRAHIRRLSKGSYPGDGSSVASFEVIELANQPRVSASAESSSEEETSLSMSDADSKSCAVGVDLTSAICKVVRLVEDLAAATAAHEFAIFSHRGFQHYSFSVDPLDDCENKRTRIVPSVQCKHSELDTGVRKFIAVSNQFLHGKVDIAHFMSVLSSVLGQLARLTCSAPDSSPPSHKKSHWGKSFLGVGESEELSGANSPVSETSKSDGSEKEASKVVPADESQVALKNGTSLVDISKIEEELRKVRSEKVALESHMRAEFGRFAGIEDELAQLRTDKVELENNLGDSKERLEHVKAQLHEADQLLANLRVQLASAEESKHLADEQLANMAATKGELESQLKASETELKQLHNEIEALETEVLEQRKQNGDLEAKCKDFQQKLQELDSKAGSTCSRCAAVDEEARITKEREIAAAAEKLAECQQTILCLGKQLKALASPKDSTLMSFDSSADPGLSVEKISSGRDFLNSLSQQGLPRRVIDETSSRAQVYEYIDNSTSWQRSGRDRKVEQNFSWDPRDSNISDLLDSELASLSKRGHGSGRTILDLFGEKTPVHEDYIEAVAQIPSSPETEQVSPQRSPPKRAPRKKKSPRSFAGIDMSKSMNDAGSPAPSSEKHSNSFSRFFSRTKSSH